MLVPLAYSVVHPCVKVFTLVTYAFDRELSLILILATVAYLLALLDLSLYWSRKGRASDLRVES